MHLSQKSDFTKPWRKREKPNRTAVKQYTESFHWRRKHKHKDKAMILGSEFEECFLIKVKRRISTDNHLPEV